MSPPFMSSDIPAPNAKEKAEPGCSYEPATRTLTCVGAWDVKHILVLEKDLNRVRDRLHIAENESITVDGSGITKMDSAGAWFFCKELKISGRDVQLINFSKEHQDLIALVESRIEETKPSELLEPITTKQTIAHHMHEKKRAFEFITKFGYNVSLMTREFVSYLAFIGQLSLEALRVMSIKLAKFRFAPLSRTVFDTGFMALPIIALLSFMIGIVVTYQMGLQLKNYGANIYIVDLLGISMLREFSPLLTAIMVAGRTGSSYTAQLGIMKINQEIDALNTMGVTPAELLILPRIAGLVIALPLLTMWSNIFGVLGGMVMSTSMLSLTWYDFLQRFQHVVTLKPLYIGLGKAPVFALIIASIGCYQGMQVYGSSESIGHKTTRSVVLSIFFIIVVDAAFSVIFSKLKL